MTDKQTEAMKLALEALENSIGLVEEDYANAVNLYGKYPSRAQRLIGMETMRDDHRKAIAALRQALANEALDKKAENARELGLDYEPVQDGGIVTAGGFDPRTQRTWVGLTDDEVIDIAGSFDYRYDVARAVEDKLKEKNT